MTTEEQKRLLAFGAILFYSRGEKILDITPVKNISQHINGLHHQWEISSSSDARETLNGLLSLHRSTEFAPLLQNPSPQLAGIKKEIAKELGVDLAEVELTKSAYAWDICRCVSLAKWCYWCGYLSEAEAWQVLQHASKIATQHGHNWTDYTVSFLLGRTLQGFDMDDVIVECKQLVKSKGPLLRRVENIDVYKKYDFRG